MTEVTIVDNEDSIKNNGTKIRTLLDTGAMVSAVNPETIKELENKPKRKIPARESK